MFLDFFALRIRLVAAGLLAAAAVVALPLVLLTALTRLVALVLLTALVRVLARLPLALIGVLFLVRHLTTPLVDYPATVEPTARQQCRCRSIRALWLQTLPL